MKFLLVSFIAALASFALAAEPVADPVADIIADPIADTVDDTVDEPIVTELTRWPPRPPPRTTTTSSFIITVTTLPGRPTITPTPTANPIPCPTVTLTTRPSNCQPIRCPIPGCTYDQDMVIPCNCNPRTLLWVEGCQTACPQGCATRTNTYSQLCATATRPYALPSDV